MMKEHVEPALPLVSILSPAPAPKKPVVEQLTNLWESLRLVGPPYRFDETRYYEDEIGHPLFRWWCYRDELADPSRLRNWKRKLSALEDEFRDRQGNRTVNLDPGYLNFGLVVLGSHKYDLQKIYLGEGVYADPVLQYGDGSFQPFPWSFPDFRQPNYYRLFERLRDRYRNLRSD